MMASPPEHYDDIDEKPDWTHAISHPGSGPASIHRVNCNHMRRNFFSGGGIIYAGTLDECLMVYRQDCGDDIRYAPCAK